MIERELRKYLIPNTLAMLGLSLYILADTFFVSTAAGADGITALNLTLPIYGILFALGAMIGVGSATRYGLAKSMCQSDMDNYFSNAILSIIIIALPFVLMGTFAPDMVLRLMGADDEILAIGLPYIRIVLMFAPFFMLNHTFTSFIRNDEAPKIAMAATLLSSLFNIVFDYVFMFPLGMGFAGAALATSISPIVSIAICMIHLLSKKNNIRFAVKLPTLRRLVFSCTLGIASFIGEISNAITTMVFNFILLALVGNISVAAYGVVANISLVGIAIFNGLSQGLQPMASEAEGSGNINAKKRIRTHSLQIGIGLALITVSLLWIFAPQIVDIFNSEHSAEMAGYAVTGLRLYSLGFIPAAANIINAGFYSATDRPKECSVISISRGIVAIVFFAFVLSRFFGIVGVWLAFGASELFTYIVSLFFKRTK